MAQAAEADDAYLAACFDAPVLHRRVGRDTRAQQRCCCFGVKRCRDFQNKIVRHDDDVRIAAKGVLAAIVVLFVGSLLCRHHGTVVGSKPTIRSFTVVLITRAAWLAFAAAIDHAPDANQVTNLVSRHRCPDGGHTANDLMAGHTGINGIPPLVLDLVNVRVTDAAVQHFDGDFIWTRIRTFEFVGLEA